MNYKLENDEFEKCLEIDDQLMNQFEFLDILGKGAYGIVWQVKDHKSQQKFILKKIVNAFATYMNAQRTFREVMVLKQMSQSPQIIQLIKVPKCDTNKDLYLLFENMDTDLHSIFLQLIRSKKKLFNDSNIRTIMYQICLGIKYLHEANYCHRDLQPRNILINEDFTLKIGDFSFTKQFQEQIGKSSEEITEFVVPNWHRAPEVLLGSQFPTSAIDIWGIGCILAEIILKRPIFEGNTLFEQLSKIFNICGKPKTKDLQMKISEAATQLINEIHISKQNGLNTLFIDQLDDTRDFLKGCLNVIPSKRLNINQLLEHQYFSNQMKENQVDTKKYFRSNLSLFLEEGRNYSIKYFREKIIHESSVSPCKSHRNLYIPKGQMTNNTGSGQLPGDSTENDQNIFLKDISSENDKQEENNTIQKSPFKKRKFSSIHEYQESIMNTKAKFCLQQLPSESYFPDIEQFSPMKKNGLQLNQQLSPRDHYSQINKQSTSQFTSNNQIFLPLIKRSYDGIIKGSLEKFKK